MTNEATIGNVYQWRMVKRIIGINDPINGGVTEMKRGQTSAVMAMTDIDYSVLTFGIDIRPTLFSNPDWRNRRQWRGVARYSMWNNCWWLMTVIGNRGVTSDSGDLFEILEKWRYSWHQRYCGIVED